jgi:hypothetical protein
MGQAMTHQRNQRGRGAPGGDALRGSLRAFLDDTGNRDPVDTEHSSANDGYDGFASIITTSYFTFFSEYTSRLFRTSYVRPGTIYQA